MPSEDYNSLLGYLGHKTSALLSLLSLRSEKSIHELGIIALSSIIAFSFVVFSALFFVLSAPHDFPEHSVVRIEKGDTLKEIAYELEAQNVIESPLIFMSFVRFVYNGDSSVVAGDYFFNTKTGVSNVARRISYGDYGLIPLSVTIPEGATVVEMAALLEQELDVFDGERFVELALPFEGYLFPDTYQFLPTADPRIVVQMMHANFNEKIGEIEEEIEAFGLPLEDVIIMASIVEKEGERDFEARQKIAGVLWRRIEIDMPLQVDAVFPYIIGRNTFELTHEDLAIDSPYNTYVHKGLPPGPISNPGLSAIKATIDPIESDYLFYLADRSGRTHFAETFEKHITNKRRYLD